MVSKLLALLALSVFVLRGLPMTQAASTPDTPEQQSVLKSQFIFETAPFPSCHASTLAETKNGLVAAWFGGTAENHPDVGIWMARLIHGTWTAPAEVADGVQSPTLRYPCWNPVLFQPKSGPLLLFYKVGPWPNSWWGMLKKSDDGGRTWSAAKRLPDGILGPIKNKPVQLANGDILCPSSTEDHGWRVHFERTSDGGETWQSTGPVNDGKVIGAIQPSILEHGGENLQAVGRTRQGRIFSISSADNGKTWGPMTLTDLPNPDSGTDAVTLRDGRFLLVYNHTPQGRSPLNVAVSNDGLHWTPLLALENGDGEFSYPAVIQTHDGLVHITYTWNRTHIKHVVLDPNRLHVPTLAASSPHLFVLPTAPYRHFVDEFNAAAAPDMVNVIPNALTWDWMTRNVPFFDCPDPEFLRTYYYRWWVFRRHLKSTPDGYTMSEFILPVSWATKQNAISCAAAQNLMEGRWLRDPKYMDGWAKFWYHGDDSKIRDALFDYSDWLPAADYARYLADGRQDFLVSLLPGMIAEYQGWEQRRQNPDGLFWQYDVRDGMEESISGSRTQKNERATINSYLYGDARAIAATARVAGKPDIAAEYDAKAAALKSLVQTKLWDKHAQFFKVRYEDGTLSDARELHGFLPWYFDLPDREYDAAWKQLTDPKGFSAPYGPTTAEQRHPKFAIAYSGHDCQWNGPSWPFATAQTLTAAANLLQDDAQTALTRPEYFETLTRYALSHRRKLEDGQVIAWVDEDLDPYTGVWIAREIKKSQGDTQPERGAQYQHSTFCDLVISGLVGLRSREGQTVEINPLLPAGAWDWFCLDAVPYHGHLLTIVWDEDGKKYGKGKGLTVFVDGKRIASRPALGRLTGFMP